VVAGHRDHHALGGTATPPMRLNSVRAGRIHPSKPITRRCPLDHILGAHETFGHAASTQAPEVIIEV
jgi:alcohol dehydrogenase